MTRDIDTLTQWIRVCLIITAICTTSLPFLYWFSPWRSTSVGKIFMLMTFSFAMVIDLSLLFQYWKPDILVIFWVDAIVLSMVALSTGLMTWMTWKVNHSNNR